MDERKVSFAGFKLTPEQAEALTAMVQPDGGTPPLTPEQSAAMDRIIAEIEKQTSDPKGQLNVGKDMGITHAEEEFIKGFGHMSSALADIIVGQCVFSSIKSEPNAIQARAMTVLTVLAASVMHAVLDPKVSDAGNDKAICIQLAKAVQSRLRQFRENPDTCRTVTVWNSEP